MKQIALWGIVIVVVIAGLYWYLDRRDEQNGAPYQQNEISTSTNETNTATTTEELGETVLGTSVEGKDIMAYHFGTGEIELLFVGGIHGGYSWNTAMLGYETVDYFEENEDELPENIKVTVIPVMNPDGLESVVGTAGPFDTSAVPANQSDTVSGRFNANQVDLNRNFDCEWASSGTWQNQTVSGGTAPFSEPESQAIRDYVNTHDIAAAVVWYSSAGGVYASACSDEVLSETRELTNVYADAANYTAHEEFDFYEITGDMVNWLARENIPAISVLLTAHDSTEWSKNRAGVEAIIEHFVE